MPRERETHMSGNDVTSTRVAILTGGWSDEREIAISSARACETALSAAGFSRVDVLDVADPSFLSALTSGSYDVAFVAMRSSLRRVRAPYAKRARLQRKRALQKTCCSRTRS